MAILVFIVLPVLLLCGGLPIYLMLLMTSLAAIMLVVDVPTTALQTYLFGSLDSFPLLAIPFFIYAGEIMGRGGIARRVMAWVLSLTGNSRGSMGLTTIVTSELFGAMSHTAIGTVAAVGRIALPVLRDAGYHDRFSIGLIASSGAVAVVIPPSISLILYSMSAQQSAIALFTAGIIPSLMLGFVTAIYVIAVSPKRNAASTVDNSFSLTRFWETTKDAGWALGTPIVIFGGIYGGIFSPTEAAGVAVLYSIFITIFIYKDISWRDLWQITMSATFLIAQISVIVAAAGVYAWLLTTSGLPQQVVAYITNLHLSHWEILLIINVGLLIIGSFLEPPAAILILTPLLLPIVQSVGVNPIHFGIIMAVNLSIGMYTPPFGLNLFASQAIFEKPLGMIYRGVVPFLAINFLTLMLISYVPWFSMSLLGGGAK